MTTETSVRRTRLAEAAQRYYLDGWSQDQVAEFMGTSRSNVSRILDIARREGIVRFVIDHPLRRHRALETALVERFGVREALVVAAADQSFDLVGRVAATRLLEEPLEGRLAVGWGRSVEATITHVAVETPRPVEVVQVGGDLTMAPAASGHELVRRLAEALGGMYRFLHAPALVESPALAADLRADRCIAAELELARTADLALIGIGIPGVGLAENAVVDSYSGAQSPAAVVCARLVDDSGEELAGPLRERVISIDLDDLRSIPTVMGVAAGTDKGRPVAAALRGRLVDTIVCDQAAATAALKATDAGVIHAAT